VPPFLLFRLRTVSRRWETVLRDSAFLAAHAAVPSQGPASSPSLGEEVAAPGWGEGSSSSGRVWRARGGAVGRWGWCGPTCRVSSAGRTAKGHNHGVECCPYAFFRVEIDLHTSIKFDLQPRNVKSEEASNIRFQTMHDHVHHLGLIVG
jgi:hypothetical protein